jgi:hypothetical protein
MALYIFIAVAITGFILFGFWAARYQKKRLKLTDDFFVSPPVKAMLDSGFQKDPNGIYGRLNNYDVGLYVWFDPGNTRYFTYLQCNIPGSISYRMGFSQKHRLAERIDIEGNGIQQELKQIDGDTLARSFARLQEIAALEKFEPLPPRPPGIVITH